MQVNCGSDFTVTILIVIFTGADPTIENSLGHRAGEYARDESTKSLIDTYTQIVRGFNSLLFKLSFSYAFKVS